jgi:DNA-binding transcriptional ArsR family regulator
MAKRGRKKIEATPEEFKAMANPLRLRILRLCLHEPRTNKEVAERLGKDPATTLHHVRLLVRTGFLEPQPVRTGARGALEKPYLATRKSWDLHVSRPEDQVTELMASVDAFRAEVSEVPPEGWIEGTRLGLKLNAASALELAHRLNELAHEYEARPSDPDGEAHGLFISLHKLA